MLRSLSWLVLASIATAALEARQLPETLDIQVTKSVECSRKTRNGDTIAVHYKGTLTNGVKFDSSYDRNDPFTFELGMQQVIEGWDKGLLDMCPGEERKLTVPADMAYGDRAMGAIPAGSTLIFETLLVGIAGVDEDSPSASPTSPLVTTPTPSSGTPFESGDHSTDADGECRLLGPFALFVQGGLGLLAVSSLVWKRYRERPRRPVLIWFFDASKQVFGSVLLHIANLLMSILPAEYAIKSTSLVHATMPTTGGRGPNPCSFYLINLAIDTTIGIVILVVLLRLISRLVALTPMAKPPESIRSGNYGQPPRVTWWLKQSIIYFIALLLMKLCVLAIFELLPWIAWVGNWALRWTEGSEAIQITFVMFIFPLIMNGLQYYIIDTYIKDPIHEIPDDEDDENDESRAPLRSDDEFGPEFVDSVDPTHQKGKHQIRTKEVSLTYETPVLDDSVEPQSSGSSRTFSQSPPDAPRERR